MRRVGRFLLLVTALLPWAAGGYADQPAADVIAEGSAPTVHADKMTFDNSTKTYNAEGNVVIQDKDATLRADHVRYNQDSREAWADGHVRLNQGAQEWVAPSLYYNFGTRTLKTDDVRGFVDPLYLHVENLEQVGSNHYVFARCSVTTCDQEQSDYHLESAHGEM